MIGSLIGHMVGPAEPDEYDIPEEKIQELAIERASSRVRDVVDVIRRALPGGEVRVSEALTIVASTALDHALVQVRGEHRVSRGMPPLHSFANPFVNMMRGEHLAPHADATPSVAPHLFSPSPIAAPDGDPRPRCSLCAQFDDALIHHPDLLPDPAGPADGPDLAP